MKKIFATAVLLLAAGSYAASDRIYLEVNPGFKLQGFEGRYNLPITPTLDKKSPSGFYIPRTINEAYVELDRMLPQEVEVAFKDMINYIDLNAESETYFIYAHSFNEESCRGLTGVLDYPCYFLHDFERFLKTAWHFTETSPMYQRYAEHVESPTEMLYLIIVSYAMQKANKKVNFRCLLIEVAQEAESVSE